MKTINFDEMPEKFEPWNIHKKLYAIDLHIIICINILMIIIKRSQINKFLSNYFIFKAFKMNSKTEQNHLSRNHWMALLK